MGNQTAAQIPGPEAKAIFQTMAMSDLHLEFPNAVAPKFPVVAPILILAGDIGRPDVRSLRMFLLDQCPRFEHIFYVAGNHCFYGGEYTNRLEQLQELDDLDPRIHFLHNKSYLLPNSVRIIGTTLWSHVAQQTALRIGQCLNDYRMIWIGEERNLEDTKVSIRRRITVEDTNDWHAQQHAWLVQEIQKARENREHAVVITHHAPSRRDTCSKGDQELGLEDAFVNDHDADCVDPVRLWVYGHTHRSAELTVNSTRLVSNPLGYVSENCGFRPSMKITLYDDGTVTVTDPVPSDS